MVIPALKERIKKLTLELAKANRDKVTEDQQIAISAWKLQQKKKSKKS